MDAASQCTLCHSNQRRRFLIFLPASGVDGCYKNGGKREPSQLLRTNVRVAVWGELLSGGGVLQSDDQASRWEQLG